MKEKDNPIFVSSLLNTVLTLLSIGVSQVYCGAAYSKETSRIFDIILLMNFFTIPHEIQKINKLGGQNKLWGGGV